MKNSSDVVITGMGVVSPIGVGLEPFWQSLLNGVSGIRLRPAIAATGFRGRIGGTVEGFDGKLFVKPRKSLKVMCPQIQFGYAAAQMAVEHAGLAVGAIDPDRLGTVFGSETFYADPDEISAVFQKCIVDQRYQHDRWGEYSMREIMPLWMLKYLPNMVASHISIAYDARGPSNTICQAEVSSQLALIEAVDWIRRGAADAVIVGGTGSPLELGAMLYRGWDNLSQRLDDPTAAMRPFDAARDGTVLGEGAAALLLENAQLARQRGARIIAKILSYDRGYCPRLRDLGAQAITRSIRSALERARMAAADVGHVNAHGVSDPWEDAIEAQGISNSVGAAPVFAAKSYFGNVGPASSIMEIIASLLATQNGTLPGTLNYERADPRCPVTCRAECMKVDSSRPFVALSFANTGQIATVVLGGAEV